MHNHCHSYSVEYVQTHSFHFQLGDQGKKVETAGILLKMLPVLQMLRIQPTHLNSAKQETLVPWDLAELFIISWLSMFFPDREEFFFMF